MPQAVRRPLPSGPLKENKIPYAMSKSDTTNYRAGLFDEELKCSFESDDEKVRVTPIMDTRTEEI